MCVFFVKQKTEYEVLRSLVGSEMCIRDSIGVLDREEQARHLGLPGVFDELHPGRVAVAEDAATTLAVTGRPLASDRPSEHVAVEAACRVEPSGVAHDAEFHLPHGTQGGRASAAAGHNDGTALGTLRP